MRNHKSVSWKILDLGVKSRRLVGLVSAVGTIRTDRWSLSLPSEVADPRLRLLGAIELMSAVMSVSNGPAEL